MGSEVESCSTTVLTKASTHLLATLLSCALATIVSTQARRLCLPCSWQTDMLALVLVSIQLLAMCLPYAGYHKAGGPVLFPPISCANHYSWLRRVGAWVAFTLLAGGMHAWATLTTPGNPMQTTTAVAEVFRCIPSAGLALLAGHPVPLRDYTTAVVARGTDVEWLTPAAFTHSVSRLNGRNKRVVRWLMAAHLLGATSVILAPSIGGLLRRAWSTKVVSCLALALLSPGSRRTVPIFHMANSLLESKVMMRYEGSGATPGWKNELNSPRRGRTLWKLVNVLGVHEHLLLNALMLVILCYQRYEEVHGAAGWLARAIALLWNVGFASWGGKWWLSRLLEAAMQHGGPTASSARQEEAPVEVRQRRTPSRRSGPM